jgi:alcohol dehydrogenase class IV
MLERIGHPLLKFKIVLADTLPLYPERYHGNVFALGGGSVIDKAKLVAFPKPCFAIPTNASGACMTSHAVIWEKDAKVDFKTPVPILADYIFLPIKLSRKNIERTFYDCLCHIIESFNSKNATYSSKAFCRIALKKLVKFLINRDVHTLIEAGNAAGMAIEITGTNFIHAVSYVYTLDYGMCHGDALKAAMNLPDDPNAQDILWKAKKYRKFFESTVLCEG